MAKRAAGVILPHLDAAMHNLPQVAVALATDLPRLALLRKTLRARLQTSVLADAPALALALEMLYRRAWHRWCNGR